jgi:hypothetical protein
LNRSFSQYADKSSWSTTGFLCGRKRNGTLESTAVEQMQTRTQRLQLLLLWLFSLFSSTSSPTASDRTTRLPDTKSYVLEQPVPSLEQSSSFRSIVKKPTTRDIVGKMGNRAGDISTFSGVTTNTLALAKS